MDYKSMYPEFLYVDNYKHSNEETIDNFNKAFNRDIVPLCKGKIVSGKTIYIAFQYYLKDKWNEFVESVKEDMK